jgi:hypothetical protein
MKTLYILLLVVSFTAIADMLNDKEKSIENKSKEKINPLFSNIYKHKYSVL